MGTRPADAAPCACPPPSLAPVLPSERRPGPATPDLPPVPWGPECRPPTGGSGAPVPAAQSRAPLNPTPVLTDVGPGAREGWSPGLLDSASYVRIPSLPVFLLGLGREGGSPEGRRICQNTGRPAPPRQRDSPGDRRTETPTNLCSRHRISLILTWDKCCLMVLEKSC